MSTPEVLTTWKYRNSGFALYTTTRCDGPSHCIFKPISGPPRAKANTRSEAPEPLERFIETVVSTPPVPKPLCSIVSAVAIHVPSGERDSADQVTGSLQPKQVKSTTAIRSGFIRSPNHDTTQPQDISTTVCFACSRLTTPLIVTVNCLGDSTRAESHVASEMVRVTFFVGCFHA